MSDIAGLLREAAQELQDYEDSYGVGDNSRNSSAELEAAAAELDKAEPVAWFAEATSPEGVTLRWAGVDKQHMAKTFHNFELQPLYRHPPSAGVPDGYVLVPVEPTDEVCNVMEDCMRDHGFHPDDIGEFDKAGCYKAMLSAAPQQGGDA